MKRSSPGLFVVLAGSINVRARVLLWKFPSEESLQADVSASGITIKLLQDAFSRKSNYFKAAMFEGTQATTSFWTGKVEDKQAKRRVTEAADFWVAGFLCARPELTEGRGTKILAKALRETIKQTPSAQEKEAIVAVADVIKSQPERDFSLREIAENYLSPEARQTFTKVIANSAVADIPFRVDAGVLEKELKFQSITINNTFIIKGPLEEFDNVDVITILETDQPDIVEVKLRGTITSRTLVSK